ncbi:unnamed protein product [Symbiodinium natans]|uniref:Thioredoxin domain-containing protein n=1 Tax=Symbiodinium natans TaxID=878477 RepID=A0A812T1Q5_9DINO|nr:unnamed protein product [Symbiodinium natans]
MRWLLWLWAALARAELFEVKSALTFEKEIFASQHVWAVGFVNGERPNPAFDAALDKLPALLPQLRFARLDVTVPENGPAASEVNVRRRTAPKLMLLPSRARSGVEVKVLPEEGEPDPESISQAALKVLEENELDDESGRQDRQSGRKIELSDLGFSLP